MPRRPWSGGTRLFSSADESDSSSDTSSDELWDHASPVGAGNATRSRAANRGGGDGAGGGGADGDMALKTLPAMAAALRASRARASAALAKASRLQEETGRLREALIVARKIRDRGDRLESDLTNSDVRVRELESCKRRLRRDLEGVKARTRQVEVKTRQSLSTLRTALKGVEERERARCRRWRATTRSVRALLESLQRHVQRGHHSTPSFTAFQLMEQLFDCLKKLEADARLPPQQSSAGLSSTPSHPEVTVDDEDRIQDSEVSPAAITGERLSPTGTAGKNNDIDSNEREHHGGDVNGGGREGVGSYRSPRPRDFNDTNSSNTPRASNKGMGADFPLSEEPEKEKAHLLREAVVRILGTPETTGKTPPLDEVSSAAGEEGRSTEWAYRLAVTKLTAQLKAARERLRGEKEAARSSGERADQEELRCRQLELEVKGLSSKVATAERHRARLETMLKESRRERDMLKQRRQRGAANHALNAARGITQRREVSAPPPPPVLPSATAPAGGATTCSPRYFGNGGSPGPSDTTGGTQKPRADGGSTIRLDGGVYAATDSRWGDELRPTALASSLPPGDGDRGGSDTKRGGGGIARTSGANHYERSNSNGISRGALGVPEEGYRYMMENNTHRPRTTSSSLLRDNNSRGEEVSTIAREGGVKSSLTGVRKVGDAWRSTPGGVGKDYFSRGQDTSRFAEGGGFGRGNGGRSRATVGGGSGASWGLGPRAVTREDLIRLDDEIANLSKTVEEAAMAQTRQILRNVSESVERPKESMRGGGHRRARD